MKAYETAKDSYKHSSPRDYKEETSQVHGLDALPPCTHCWTRQRKRKIFFPLPGIKSRVCRA